MANLSNKVSPLGVAVNESPTFTGGITVTGTVAATDFTGDGSTLTGITTLTGTETLTNKTVALGTNSISGTTAQFNTALTDGNFATLAGTETLTNKTLTSAILGGTTTAGPINVTGTVAATDFTGDGSALTGIAAGIEWVLKTTTYTAVTRDAIIANTSGGVWTLTLPATPATGDYVQILDGADWATNNLTVARNGQTVEGEATDLIMNIGGVSVNLIFDGTTWQIAAQVGGNGDGVTLDAPQTLTNKTLTAPILTGTTTVDALVVNTNNYPSAGSLSGRNRIINGNFNVWQRATSGSSNGYVADRWVNFLDNSAAKTITRTAFALGQTDVPNNPTYYASSVVVGNAAVNSYAIDQQRIEGVRTFSGQTVTVSFWCKADAPKNIALEFEQIFGTGGSPSAQVTGIGTQLIAVTASWAKYTVTATVPSISGKTLGSNNNDNVSLNIWYSAGTFWTARTGGLTAQSGTFDLAQVQIEEGDVATPFERVDTGLELAKCQRFYHRTATTATSAAKRTYNHQGGFAAVQVSFDFPVTMRASPTLLVYGDTGDAAQILLGAAGSSIHAHGFTVFTNIINGAFLDYHYHTADAEL